MTTQEQTAQIKRQERARKEKCKRRGHVWVADPSRSYPSSRQVCTTCGERTFP